MSVSFPTSPAAASADPYLLRFGADLTPPLGGAVQRISRLGSRYGVDLAFPPMTRKQASAMLGALLKSEAEGLNVVASWPQEDLPASLGSPLVNGGGQLGTTLNAKGLTAGVTILAGTFFSMTAAGRIYLHATSADVTASGGGTAALPIGPMLRASPADNAVLNFAAPQIEGLVSGDRIGWNVSTALHYGLAFTLIENE